MSKTFHLRPWGRISAFFSVTADSDADALQKVKQALYAGREEAFPGEWEIQSGTLSARGGPGQRPAADDPALPPPEWLPPAAPIGFDRRGPDAHPTARLTEAISAILEAFGPMTAEQVEMALVVYGFGPLLDAADAPQPKRRRTHRGSRWKQSRLPGIG